MNAAIPSCWELRWIAEIHSAVGELRAVGRRVVVLTDKAVAEQQSGALAAMFGDAPQSVLTAGETSKSIASFGTVLEFLAAQQMDRGGVLFAVGGGVIGDLGGFAAAAYLRGIEFYQVPTTLLAMVDSSVGGKTGIDPDRGQKSGRRLLSATRRLYCYGHAGHIASKGICGRDGRGHQIWPVGRRGFVFTIGASPPHVTQPRTGGSYPWLLRNQSADRRGR